MKQKIFGVVLAALLAVCLLPAAAMAESGICGANGNNLTWELDTGVLTISGEGAMADYAPLAQPWYSYRYGITEVVITEGVTSIGERAFNACTKLNSVKFDENSKLESIGEWAFCGCEELESITIPNSVTSIGSYAFQNCTNLKSVTFEGNSKLESIGEGAFDFCTSLISVTIPSGVTSIKERAFNACEKLESITIPNSVTSIGGGVFAGCGSLKSVTIPNSVTSIGGGAFNACEKLESITIPNSVTSIGKNAFQYCGSLSSITIPSGVTSIGDWTFAGCTKLMSITIPNSVDSIGNYAFSDCTNLTTIKCQGTVAPILNGINVFSGSPISIIVIPAGAKQSYIDEGWDSTKLKEGYSAGVATIGGGKASATPYFAAVGEPVTLTATPDAGCYFVEWRSNDVVVSGNSFTMPSHDVVVTAVFAEYSSDPFFYVLNFETNGGSEIKTFTSEDVVTVSLADYKPTKEGYTFTGWYSDRDLTKKITSVRLNADRTVYAGWEEVKTEPEPTIKDCKRDNTCPAAQFADLDLNAWYHDGIHFCLENGLMNGVENKIFAPNEPTNRAMIATILWRMEDKPVINYAMQFTDVNADTWYGEAVRWAAGEGIINGYEDSTFKPDSNITREELAAVLYRYAEYKKADITAADNLTKFADNAKVSPWAEDAMKWAVACNIINGDEQNLLNPQGSATRAEVAAMLARLSESIAK